MSTKKTNGSLDKPTNTTKISFKEETTNIQLPIKKGESKKTSVKTEKKVTYKPPIPPESQPKEVKQTAPRKRKKKLNPKIVKGFTLIIMTIAFGFLIYSSYNIYRWFKDNNQIVKLTKVIQEKVNITDVDESEKNVILPENEEEPKENPYWDYIKMSLIDVDLNELKKTNSDVIGWVQVNGTNINYPFVQTNNNDYYLTHAFDKSFNYAGWIFLDYRNNINDLDKNTIIYGHGRLDNTMFGSLKNILNTNWYNNLDNHIIKVVLNGTSSLWQVFSVYRIPNTNDYIRTSFNSDEDFQSFTDMIQQRSVYHFNTEVLPTDKILTLSTCYDLKEKVVMHAKLIKYTT